MKIKLLLTYFIFLVLLSACSTKVVEPVKKVEPKNQNTVKIVEGPRATPCTMFSDLRDGEDVKGNYAIYKSFLKNKEFDLAYEYWILAMHKAPGSNGKVQYHYDDGIKIFKHYYEMEKDTSLKKKWIDSIDWVYNKRIECFGDEAYVLGRKAFDYYYYFNKEISQDTIFSLFAKAVDIKKEKSDYFVINPFSKMLYDSFKKGEIDTATTKHYANILVDAINYGSKNCKGTECQAWEMIRDYAPNLLDNFENIEEFYPSDYYENKYFALFEQNKSSCDTVRLAFRKMSWGGCDMNSSEFSELVELKNTTCYIAPPEPGPLRKAFDLYEQGKYSESIKHFNIFIDKTDDVEKKAKYLYLIAKIYYRDIKNFPLSRKYALRAASFKSNWGEPYLLIGKLYASSGPICGPGRGWDSQIVTWPALDKFLYAKSIDKSVSKEANKMITAYRKFMPSTEDIFQRTLKEGDDFKVGCWINETTKIRAAKK